MILTDDRSELNKGCANARTTILVLSGTEESRAGTIHECMEDNGWEGWYRWFLITNLSVLTSDEKNAWFEGNNHERYAVLGGAPPKSVAARGRVKDLLLPGNDECDILTIQEELAKGDMR
jgi:hypothetical protein